MQELGVLVRRDHDDMHYALRVMSEPLSDEAHVIVMLDRLRSVFPAHVDAEAAILGAILERRPPPVLYLLASQVIAAHLAQETVFHELVKLRPGTTAFRERARYLRSMMVHHADHEAAGLHPALPDHLSCEIHRTLATSYAIERDRIVDTRLERAQLRSVG